MSCPVPGKGEVERQANTNKYMGSSGSLQGKQFEKDTQDRATDWMEGLLLQRLAMKWNESEDSSFRSMRPPVTKGKHTVGPICY